MTDLSAHYILATGGKDVKRLRLLHEVYGPGTEALFHRVGLRDGQRVVEIGCSSGNIACWVAQQIAPSGSVMAIDISPDQIEGARQHAQRRNLRNIDFQVADAYSPRLPEGTFDLVYCRLVLMHLRRPEAALRAMRSLARPWRPGRLRGDGSRLLAVRPSDGCDDSVLYPERRSGRAAWRELLPGRIAASTVPRGRLRAPRGRRELRAGTVGRTEAAFGMTFAEFAPELVREGLASQEEVDRVAADLITLADDETTLFGFPLVAQVWAVR